MRDDTRFTVLVTGDPKASHITMRDDDRIAIMYMVKEGRLTTAQALELVTMTIDLVLYFLNQVIMDYYGHT